MATKLYKYQKEGVLDLEDYLREGGGALLADDMGLGKTLQALYTMKRQKVAPMFPALVVCPAAVKYTWERQAATHVNIRAHVLEGRRPPHTTMGFMPKLTIINPEILHAWAPYLKRQNFQTLVLDESQYFANLNAQRTKAAIDVARGIPSRLALSGTPLTNRPAELWPTLHILRPDVFRGFMSYAHDFCKPRMAFGKWEFKGAENLPKLHTLLKRTCMVRRLKADVMKDLPPKVRQVIPVELSDYREYRHARDNFMGWLKQNYGKVRAQRATHAAAVTKVGYLLRLAAKLKCQAAIAWVNRWLAEYPNEKIILYAIHHKMIRVLQRRVKAKSVTVDGNITGRRRQLAVDQFRRDPETRVLIGNIKAAGTGIDGLQDVCSNLAFMEMWWRPGDHIQAEDRIHRIGQAITAWVYYMVAGGTIEEKLCQILQVKQNIIHATLDGEDYEGGMDVFDQLLKVLEAEL